MHRLLSILMLNLLLAGLGMRIAAAGERVYVLSQAGAALTEILVEDGKAGASIALDKAPAAMAIAASGALAFVTHPDLGRVSVVDLGRRTVVKSTPVAGSPFGIAVTRTGRLYVGDWNGAHITVLDGSDAPRGIPVGRAPAHLLLAPDETHLFVANREDDTVSVVRTSDGAVEATIPVGHAPFAMALSPDGGRLYVGNVQAGTVSVIDTAALKVVETLASGAMPYGAAITPDGARALITNQQAGTVAVLASGGEKKAIKVGGYPEGVAISGGGTQAYVANWFSDDVSVLDLASAKEVRRIKCPAGPRAVAVIEGVPRESGTIP